MESHVRTFTVTTFIARNNLNEGKVKLNVLKRTQLKNF